MTPDLALVETHGLRFYVRPGTTDAKVLPEVVGRQVYAKRGFLTIEPTDHWLDLGANIGAFTVLAASQGAAVRAFEPEPENFGLLQANVTLNGLHAELHEAAVVASSASSYAPLYLCGGPYNRYRHTLRPVRGRQSIRVNTIPLASLLDGWPNAVKADIEGAEIAMLSSGLAWPGIRKLALEYDFDQDSSIPRFHQRMDALREVGFEVRHRPLPARKATYDYWPSGLLVHAVRHA